MDADQIVLIIAEKLREIATRQGNIPFLTGDLRKSIIVHHLGEGRATVGSNLPYARAVHDGRPALTIYPKNKKFLKFTINGKEIFAKSVFQPARKGVPFLMNAWETLRREDWGWLTDMVGKDIADQIRAAVQTGKSKK